MPVNSEIHAHCVACLECSLDGCEKGVQLAEFPRRWSLFCPMCTMALKHLLRGQLTTITDSLVELVWIDYGK